MVDDDVQAIFRALCDHQRAKGPGADMSLAELQIGLGVTQEQLGDAVTVARISDDLFVPSTAPDRLTLGPSWRARCKDREQPVRRGPGADHPAAGAES